MTSITMVKVRRIKDGIKLSAMKRINAILLATAVLSVAACVEKPQADSPQQTQKGELVEMTLNGAVDDNVGLMTRTTYSGRNIFWEEEDAITVFFEGDDILSSTFTESLLFNDNRQASFTGLGDESANAYLAVYPAAEGYTYDGTDLTVTIPSEQVAVRNGFASGANVSVAYSSDSALKFRNVGSLIAFRFETAEDAARTASVTFRAKAVAEGEYLGITGSASVNIQEQQPEESSEEPVKYIPVVAGSGSAGYVTLAAPEGGFEYNATSPVTYYAVIYPGNYANGFELTYTTNDQTPQTFTINNDEPVELTRNSLLSMGAIPNPYDTLPEVITISLDFLNATNVNPLGSFPKMAEQSAEGNDYTWNYSYEYDGKAMTEPMTFTLYKGSGYSYTYLNGAATGTDKYLYILNSSANTCMKFPAIRGRYLKSVSISHTGTAYIRNFRLQEGYPTAGHYYTISATPETAESVATASVKFPTGTDDTAKLNETKPGVSYYVQFTNASKYSITNITLVYTKQEPVAEEAAMTED